MSMDGRSEDWLCELRRVALAFLLLFFSLRVKSTSFLLCLLGFDVQNFESELG